MPGLNVNLLIRLSNSQEPLLGDTRFRHLLRNTQHLPTPQNTRKLLLSNLHRPLPSTSSAKEPHSTQLNKTPLMVLRFLLKVPSAKRNMKLIHKVGSSLMLMETRYVTEHHL